MTRERCKELLPVMTAWANGEGVQVKVGEHWWDIPDPRWADGDQYRIKPKPREVWVNEYSAGLGGGYYATETEARSDGYRALGAYIKPVLFREVLP